jgi:hypothetical protein
MRAPKGAGSVKTQSAQGAFEGFYSTTFLQFYVDKGYKIYDN